MPNEYMELRQLRTFLSIAELGSFSAAAERNGIAQPALSRQIQALEAEFGVRLFHRHGRGVRLTEEGQRLVTRAIVILREAEQARAELNSAHGPIQGELSFGVPPTVADVLSVPLIQKFRHLHPGVRLQVMSSYSGYVLDWLQRGIVDLGIIYETKELRTIKTQPLVLERLMLVQSGGAGDPIRFPDLAGMKILAPTRRHGLRILVDTMAAQCGFAIEPIVEVDSLPAQIELVARGVGATILPLVAVYSQVEAGQLVARPIVEPEITRRLLMATPIDRVPTAATNLLENMISDEISELVSSGRWQGVLFEN